MKDEACNQILAEDIVIEKRHSDIGLVYRGKISVSYSNCISHTLVEMAVHRGEIKDIESEIKKEIINAILYKIYGDISHRIKQILVDCKTYDEIVRELLDMLNSLMYGKPVKK